MLVQYNEGSYLEYIAVQISQIARYDNNTNTKDPNKNNTNDKNKNSTNDHNKNSTNDNNRK